LFIQTALLYTASDGTRRIRVHNSAVPLTNNISHPLEHLDVNALIFFMGRQSMSRIQTVPNINSARSLVEMTCSSICRAVNRSYSRVVSKLFILSEKLNARIDILHTTVCIGFTEVSCIVS
jgi:hypothetical protein